MTAQYGSLHGNSMGLSAVPLDNIEHCRERLTRLQAKRDRETKPGEPWEHDGAIEHAKRELAAAIEREQSEAE